MCEMDLREGGKYRWRWRNNDDNSEFGFTGVFRKLEPGVRIVHTQVYDAGTTGVGMGDGEANLTATFTETNGITTVTTVIDFGSKASRDASMATGMTDGMEQGYQLLEQVLSSTPSQPEAGQARA